MTRTRLAAAAVISLSLSGIGAIAPAFADAPTTPANAATSVVKAAGVSGVVTHPDAVVAKPGTTVTVDVAANDVIPDGLTVSSVTTLFGDESASGEWGSMSIVDNQLVFHFADNLPDKATYSVTYLLNVTDGDSTVGFPGAVNITTDNPAPAPTPTPGQPGGGNGGGNFVLPPNPVDDSFLVREYSPVTFDVASNDDLSKTEKAALASGDLKVTLPTSSVSTEGGKVLGTVAVQGGKVVFTPKAGVTGTGDFLYTLDNGHGSISADVTVMVDPTWHTAGKNGRLQGDYGYKQLYVGGTKATFNDAISGKLVGGGKAPAIAKYTNATLVSASDCDSVRWDGDKVVGKTLGSADITADGQVSLTWPAANKGPFWLVETGTGVDGKTYEQIVEYGNIVDAPKFYPTGRVPAAELGAASSAGGFTDSGPTSICYFAPHASAGVVTQAQPPATTLTPPTGDNEPLPNMGVASSDKETSFLAGLAALMGLAGAGLGIGGLRRRRTS